MIKGSQFPDRLDTLLLFEDNRTLFEKELITGFRDNYIKEIVEYEHDQREIKVYLYPYGDDIDREPGCSFYQKDDLIEIAIEEETRRALIHLQKNYKERNDYSWHQWIFARILKCYLAALKVSENDYPYKNLFIECFADVVKKSISLYEGIFGTQFNNLKVVKVELQSIQTQNTTGFQLKPEIYKNINHFTNGLIVSGFIDEADSEKFKKFLKGKKPTEKIDWEVASLLRLGTSRVVMSPIWTTPPSSLNSSRLYRISFRHA